VVAAPLERLLGVANDLFMAVAQGAGQRLSQLGRAAAALAELIVDLTRRGLANVGIAVVEGVDQCGHHFGRAFAVVLVADLADSRTPLTRIAGGLRVVDQVRQPAALFGREVAAVAIVAAGSAGTARPAADSARAARRSARLT